MKIKNNFDFWWKCEIKKKNQISKKTQKKNNKKSKQIFDWWVKLKRN
jgi:hypothetical protein